MFERDTTFGLIMDLSRLSHNPAPILKKILEQQRCPVSQERCSLEQQSNAGENPAVVINLLVVQNCVGAPWLDSMIDDSRSQCGLEVLRNVLAHPRVAIDIDLLFSSVLIHADACAGH
jgi:hypothetical protein